MVSRACKKGSAYMLFNEQSAKYRFRAAKFAQEAGYVPVYPTIHGDFFKIKQDLRKAKDSRGEMIRKCDEVWVFGSLNASMWDQLNFARSLEKTVRSFSASKEGIRETGQLSQSP